MPLHTETNSLTEVYAKSFLEIAGNNAPAALDELREVVGLTRSIPAFGELLGNPVVSAKHREHVLRKALDGRVSEGVLRFLLVLNQKGRLAHLPGVVTSLSKMVQERSGKVEVMVLTAKELTSTEADSLRHRLSQALGREVVLSTKEEAGMLGGVKIRIGDQLLDGSFATQLRRMKDRLTVEGGASMRSRIAGMLA